MKAPERTQNFDANLGGTIMPNKSSFSLFVGGRKQYDTPVATFTTIDGRKQSRLLARRPNDGWNVNGMLDYALTTQHMLRVGYSQNQSERRNLGIGGFDLTERAYSNESFGNQVRMQETGPIGANVFLNSRLQLRYNDSASVATLEAPTIRVLDSFTRGGAQVRGGRHAEGLRAVVRSELHARHPHHAHRHPARRPPLPGRRHVELPGHVYLLEPTRFRAGPGPQLHPPHRRSADHLLARSKARSTSRTICGCGGTSPSVPGLRYEVQTHVHDLSGFAPRLGVTWAPGENGRTTIRTSWGIFYNWLPTNVYEQTLRVNGVRQREVNIVNPPFPDLIDDDPATPCRPRPPTNTCSAISRWSASIATARRSIARCRRRCAPA